METKWRSKSKKYGGGGPAARLIIDEWRNLKPCLLRVRVRVTHPEERELNIILSKCRAIAYITSFRSLEGRRA